MKAFDVLKDIAQGIKDVCAVVLGIVPPVAGVLIGLDVVVGTNFGVLTRLTTILAKVGISGNVLTILLIVGLVLWYTEKRKG